MWQIDSLIPEGMTYQAGCDYCRCVSLSIIRESENLDGSRFMLQQHLKLLFREEPGNGMRNWYEHVSHPPSSSSAHSAKQQGKWLSNDIQLSYALRKYADAHSFVLPCAGIPELCVDADSDRGSRGTTTTGQRITVRTDYIFRLFSRGSLQVWSERLRHLRPRAPLLFAHSRTDGALMLRLMLLLERQGVDFMHVLVTGHTGVSGASEAQMRAVFGFNDFDLANQRLGFFCLNIGADYERKASGASSLADTIIHITEVLKATRPPLVLLPTILEPSNARTQDTVYDERAYEARAARKEAKGARAVRHAAITAAHLAAYYLDIPVFYVHG